MKIEAANDNHSTKLAEQLAALLEYRNRPDSPPDPLQSSWGVTPDAVIVETESDDGEHVERFEEDLLLEVTPSIREIVRQVSAGDEVRNENGQIVQIGTLRFSDGEKHERAYKRGPDGDVVGYMRRMPLGAMLGAKEKIGGPHAGGPPPNVTISNSNLVALLLGRDESGQPKNFRPYQAGRRDRRRGRSYTADESRVMIAEAIANTKVMPPVTKCPPGVACGTAKYSDQFIGLKIGSTGKGGAPNWVDFFMAGREYDAWMESLAALDGRDAAVLEAAMSARSLKDVGVAAGQTSKYAQFNGGGKRALIAANDNLAEKIRDRRL
jgi:hypothetical protein